MLDIYGFAAGPYKTNTYIIGHQGRGFIVDPGLFASQRALEIATEHEITIEAIYLSHGHLDHMREAGDLAAQLQIPVYIHPADAFMLADGSGVSEASRTLFRAQDLVPIADLRDLPDSGALTIAGIELHLAHAPGHSPGSIIATCEEIALVGDVVFRGSIGRTDLPHSDPAAMEQTLATVVAALDDRLTLLCGHGPTTTMRVERRTNPYLQGLAPQEP